MTRESPDRTTTGRRGMVDRLNANRQRVQIERNGQAGSTEARPQSPTASAERVRTPVGTDGTRSRADVRDRLVEQRTAAAERPRTTTAPAVAVQQQVAQTEARRRELGSRLAERARQPGSTPIDPATPSSRTGTFSRTRDYSGYRDRISSPYHRPSYLHATYYDRPDLIRHDYRHIYTYYDHYHRLHHRVIWPSYYYPVCYNFGPYVSFRYVYPYYHRKYVFVSLGGWWPSYSYVRYYWYGYHPYLWYGYYPIAYEVPSDNNNYYTYNYYYQNDDGGYTSYSSDTPVQSDARPVDESTWADVRAKLDQQKNEPAPQTVADTRFEEGVESFETGNYDAAAGKFEEAMRLAPNDMILPFAYSQALFADGQYAKSADMLREALSENPSDKEGVFYPRGLYKNDDVLFAQIENLVDKLENSGYDADMQLLLGYHLLGVGETGYAREPLERARQDAKNAESATVLLKLLEKIESEAGPADKADGTATEPSAAATLNDAQPQAESTPAPGTETTIGGVQPLSAPDTPAESAPDSAPAPGKEEKPAAPNSSGSGGVVVPASPARDGDDNSTPIVPAGANSSREDSGSGAGASASMTALFSDAMDGIGRYLRADFAVFAGIVVLGWTGVCLQWRFLDRGRA